MLAAASREGKMKKHLVMIGTAVCILLAVTPAVCMAMTLTVLFSNGGITRSQQQGLSAGTAATGLGAGGLTAESGGAVTVRDGDTGITAREDIVRYKPLEPGKTYVIQGTLIDRDAEEASAVSSKIVCMALLVIIILQRLIRETMKECYDTGPDSRDGEDVKKICTKTAGYITAKGNGFDESGYPAGIIPVGRSDVTTGVSARGFPVAQACMRRHHGKMPRSGTGVHDICLTTSGNLHRD